MKALDYFLIISALMLLGISYYTMKQGNYEIAALINFCAYVCGAVWGTRIGGRIHKKNQENK